MHSDCCFICGSTELVEPTDPSPEENEVEEEKRANSKRGQLSNPSWKLIDKEVNVIFVLKTLFQVPKDKLGKYLGSWGNPSEWGIKLCGGCGEIVKELRGIHEKIVGLQRRFEGKREEARRRLKQVEEVKREEENGGGRGSAVFKEARAFICGHNYSSSSSSGPPPYQAQAPEDPDDFLMSLNLQVPTAPSITFPSGGGPQQFQCSKCPEKFQNSGKLKEHAIVRHPEQFFPPEHFGPSFSSSPNFRQSCLQVFREEKVQSNGLLFNCSLCSEMYLSIPAVWVHLVDGHYGQMAAKLKRKLQPGLHPPGVFRRGRGRPRGSGNAGYPPTTKCRDCGAQFGSAPGLSRHRNHHCPVRRDAGLLRFPNGPIDPHTAGRRRRGRPPKMAKVAASRRVESRGRIKNEEEEDGRGFNGDSGPVGGGNQEEMEDDDYDPLEMNVSVKLEVPEEGEDDPLGSMKADWGEGEEEDDS